MQRVVKQIETNLKKRTYFEIGQALAGTESGVLVQLLDSRSIKVGDTAADFLAKRSDWSLVVCAILERRIATKTGKIRGQNVLFRFGRDCPGAFDAYIALLKDRDDEVADNALLALVCWGNKLVIPLIKERAKVTKGGKNVIKQFELAIEALEKSDPSIFDPNFVNNNCGWR